MLQSAKLQLAELPQHAARAWLLEQEQWVLDDIERDAWWWTGRPAQMAPAGDWFIWLMLTGRGFGKTRAGAEWIIEQALKYPRDRAGNATNWLVLGATIADTRTFCIDGPSGILAGLRRRGLKEGVDYHYTKAPRPIITLLADGQVIYFEGVDDADTGRGYNLAGAWLDEVGKWRYTDTVWREGVMPSLRADLPGSGRPRVVVTTTPKPIKLLKGWVKRAKAGDPAIRLTAGSTYDNAANLSPAQLAEFRKEYEGTTIGRQEMHGELLEEVDGALWTHANIEKYRVRLADVPGLHMVVVGMDPAGTGAGDEMGLVAVGRGDDDEDYVLADWSKRMAGRPAARRAWELFLAVDGDLLVYEDNLGKRWLTQVMNDSYAEMQDEGLFPPGGAPPCRAITAVDGKRLRAQPTAMRYEQGRVHHVGTFDEMEDQMATWVPDQDPNSPDRVDALVHAQALLRSRERYAADLVEPSGNWIDRADPYGA
ncbi:MAG: terminase family protein [Acidimicrobiales bacterium]